MQLCCCLISKFIDMLKSMTRCPWLYALAPPSGPHPSARGKRIVSAQRSIDVYETSHYHASVRQLLLGGAKSGVTDS